MALEGYEEISVRTRLTKGNVAPASMATTDDMKTSALIEETKESKAKDYVAEESNEVTAQYVGTITMLNSKLSSNNSKLEAIEKRLEIVISPLLP